MRRKNLCKLSACALFFVLCSAYSLSWLRFDQPPQLNAAAAQRITERLAGSDNFTFALVGDSRGNPGKFREILAAAAAHDPAFIMHAGDFSTIGSAEQYAEAVKVMQGCPVPVVVITGNHDLVTDKGRFFEQVFGPLDFYFQAGNFRFICINNTDDVLDGRFIRLPAGDAPATLEELAAGKLPACIVMHQPPATTSMQDHVSVPVTAPLTVLLQKPGVDIRAILCGHVHGYASAELEGVPVIISGGAGAPLQANKGTGFVSRFNFVLVNVRGRSVSHTVHFVD
jgi:3',5'-cyclic AMP phosphodiesterase CpdA